MDNSEATNSRRTQSWDVGEERRIIVRFTSGAGSNLPSKYQRQIPSDCSSRKEKTMLKFTRALSSAPRGLPSGETT